MMGGFAGILAAVFGVIWMIFAVYIGAGPFALFGLVFIAFAVGNAVYSFKNATGKQRYSEFDIVDSDEEADPLNERFGNRTERAADEADGNTSKYCPYCGAQVKGDYEFCNQCGKRLP